MPDFKTLCVFWASLHLSLAASYSKPRNCSENVAITTDILSKHQVANYPACQKLCDDEASCVGFNFESRKKKKCVLNSAIAGRDGDRLAYKPSFTYTEKLDSSATKFETTSCQNFPGCKPLWKFDNHVNIVSRRDTYGYWGRDTWPGATDDYYYEQTSYSDRRELYEYTNLQNFKNDIYTTVSLPFGCDGTNHIVYKRVFYCGGYNTNRVYTFDLDKRAQSTTISLANVEGRVGSYRDQCSYHFNHYSDIDMASDQYGVWVIWARYQESCAFAISKIDHETKTIVKSWFPPRGIEFDHNDYGNAFMVCGNMYVKNNYCDRDTYVRWIYYTGNSSWVEISGSDPNRIIMQNYNCYNSYNNFSPRDNKNYAWENAQHNTYQAYFKDWS